MGILKWTDQQKKTRGGGPDLSIYLFDWKIPEKTRPIGRKNNQDQT